MKIAVLYICTGKYSIFWPEFFESSERYFLPGNEKYYFVFSDTLSNSLPDNVALIHQEKMGWPYDTLMRFSLFNGIKDKLSEFDWIFFCNANLLFLKEITNDIFLTDGEFTDIITVRHPFFYWVKNPEDFPYERRKNSEAYMPKAAGKVYVMGGFNGGKAGDYIEMTETLNNWINVDNEKGITAVWHDESHLNKYIFETNKKVKILEYNYGFPEGHDLPLKNDVYITFLDKEKFGGHDFLRGQKNSIPEAPVQKKYNPVKWLKRKAKSLL